MRHRESIVASSYRSHARELDGTARGAPPGPVQQRLESFTAVRGLIFGAYGEASADVHDLISTAADRIAQQQWQIAGARSASTMSWFQTKWKEVFRVFFRRFSPLAFGAASR